MLIAIKRWLGEFGVVLLQAREGEFDVVLLQAREGEFAVVLLQAREGEFGVVLLQAREGEFRVPHQEQRTLDPYAPEPKEEVHYPTLGQRKPAAPKVFLHAVQAACCCVP